ncbi:ABC transporter substrate-binding protein [Vibrio genomosp. F10 str. 9ZC157]|uniref:Probable sugar-binding periplasmic protein n=1 Tax=Vibrio genomosp. F10 str. ZF-129 TaxID=1187848 RepID=A0A1E5BGU7_9VIBR|nr:ABC transporter substrate-binding protein [Vibrio genomosp. F10]OEE35856.1 sugar ABC transporter substrate-binding protein [Vibrio genomosp. F10 str. ZF-129]OEE96574.1 sugar ABC transporter substrate-binding protein [Vibrio genomosp. F10 str. 9ZC157]
MTLFYRGTYTTLCTLTALGTSLLLPSFHAMAEVEFLHWWTSNGEKKSLTILEEHLSQSPQKITTSSVLGGGGDSAMTVLQARALAGNTPSFAQIEGPSIKAWDAIGILHSINEVALKHEWDDVLYPLSVNINKTENGYVALPLTLHRLNWLWVNHRLLNQLALDTPKTWPDMFDAMHRAKQQGIIPLAIGEQPWQIAQLFESFVIASGGVDFYKTALVDLNRNNIDSIQMRHALKQLRRLSLLLNESHGEPLANQKWDTATAALANDKALFQLGGDWILGDLLAAGVSVPSHIGCYPAPQSHNIYLYNMDSFIFMESKNFSQQDAIELANILADKSFQTRFNKAKGSIPVRSDIDITSFNPCQIQSYQDFNYAMEHGLAAPSMTDSMAVNPMAQQAINSEIFRYYRDASVTENEVVKRIISIAESN